MASCQCQSQSNAGGWILDYGLGDEVPSADFIWASTSVDDPAVAVGELFAFDPILKDAQSVDNASLKKRTRVEVCCTTRAKATREKMRRDRLNDRHVGITYGHSGVDVRNILFLIRVDVYCQLRLEALELKESNEALKSTVKILKISDLQEEKSELRDEKLKLKAEKARMEQMIKSLQMAAPPFIPRSSAASPIAFQSPYHLYCSKTLPYSSYPPPAVWQWIPPAALDISQDHVLRPPVA
ncbi:Transcription factor bHLH115 [Apostasia shenzhenica]|uniref:Transcription factor bHLH115 n=1 Tax=Apostasia shenzhenica TaxID=1088818 RepID=A0A2I0B839_9ASPA|nr:Transcription factor bHLH115 [Apostasia shenzhenica]